MPIPKKLRAADNSTIRVETRAGFIRDPDARVVGRHYPSPGNKHNRVVVSTIQSPSSTRETLWHELLHDSAARGGVKNNKVVERILDSLDGWSLGLLRKNPELRDYLFEDTEESP